MLSVRGFPPLSAAANALSTPPGEYGRKTETQRITGARTSGGACGLIEATRRTLPGLDIL